MKPIQRIYCRTFQALFRLSIPLLPYRRPETVAGVDGIPAVLRENGCGRVLIVTGPNVVRHGLVRPLEEALDAAGIFYAVYGKTVPNPTTATVEEAYALYRAQGCQAIIGFGGGSNMDCAKAVGIRAVRPNTPLSQCAGVLRVRKRLPLLAAVPTTAGSGSEATIAAVITDADTHHKYAISDFPLIPRYAVLDPETTVSLPPFVTACTGMDALTHAVEAYIGRSTTADTRRDALEAVRLIFENLDAAYDDGSNLEARRNMLQASYLAGCAFTKSYVGYVHAIAHSLGGKYDVPHGYANAVILPLMLRAYVFRGKRGRHGQPPYTRGALAAQKKLAELARYAGLPGVTPQTPDLRAALALINHIGDMNRRFGIGGIRELRAEDIPALARTAAKEANPLYPVPVLMDAPELETAYETLLDM